MVFFIFLTILYALLPHLIMLDNSSQYIKIPHNFCVDFLTSEQNLNLLAQSVICGSDIKDTQLINSLHRTSLIHVFIISGSHLLLLSEVLEKMRITNILRLGIIFFYSAATNLQAPALRACLSLFIKEANQKVKLNLSPDLISLAAGLLTLVINPNLLDSRSLQLSWLASLALYKPTTNNENNFKGHLCTQLRIYTYLMPALYGFASLHPLSIIFNLVLGGLIGIAIIPLALLSQLNRFFLNLLNILSDLIILADKYFAEPVMHTNSPSFSNSIIWIWIFGLHLIIALIRTTQRTGKDPCVSQSYSQ